MELSLQLRTDMTRSSILWTVLGSNTNLGSNIWRSNNRGTWVSSIFAAKDKHATDSSWSGHPFASYKPPKKKKIKTLLKFISSRFFFPDNMAFSRESEGKAKWGLPGENGRKGNGQSSWLTVTLLLAWTYSKHAPTLPKNNTIISNIKKLNNNIN